jgi:hypothetical protein
MMENSNDRNYNLEHCPVGLQQRATERTPEESPVLSGLSLRGDEEEHY